MEDNLQSNRIKCLLSMTLYPIAMIPRESYLRRIRPFIDQELIKVITGLRRCGKSVLLELIQNELLTRGIQPDAILTFNFESLSHRPLCTAPALYDELKRRIGDRKDRIYLFFDEIQEVSDWQRCVNSCRVDFNCDIYLTGSNARLLSGELATYLSGRYVAFEVFPFSFAEFCDFRKEIGLSTASREAFDAYLAIGGMPVASLLREQSTARQYLRDLYASVVLKDIIERNGIRNADLLERVIHYLSDNIGQIFSATNVNRFLKTEEDRSFGRETILNYVKACQNAFLFHAVPREDLSGKRVLTVNEKLYLADHGLREAAFAGESAADIGQVLENMICLELLRRGFSLTVGRVGAKEVDFVARRGEEKLYVQVAYLLATPDVIEREFSVLRQIPDNWPKHVVTCDEFDFSRDGIRHWNIRRFLTDTSWG